MIVETDSLGVVPRIIDFGIALSRQAPRTTETGMVLGTPPHMAPELSLGHAFDHRIDLFALAYQLICGMTPFDLEGVDAVLANILLNLVAKRPDDPQPRRETPRRRLRLAHAQPPQGRPDDSGHRRPRRQALSPPICLLEETGAM